MEETSSLTNSIIQTINTIFQTLFFSIDNNIYELLDHLVFINNDILNDSIFEKIFGTSTSNGLLIIANSLLIGFSIYYAIRLLYSYYMNLQIERPYQFIFKLLIFGIVMNCSYSICQQFLELNSLISESIQSLGINLFGCEISFSELIDQLNEFLLLEESQFNIFSFEGLLKGFISASLFNLIFSYSLRYVLVKLFILLTPFAVLSLINQSTSWFFKTWFRTILSLLLQQSLVALILVLIFSVNLSSSNILSKLLCVGGMYALIRANSYMRNLIGGISTDISNHFNMGSNFLKNK